MMDEFRTDLERSQYLQNLLIAHATGNTADDSDYQTIRRALLNNREAAKLLPTFVRTCRDLSQFWGYIKYEKSTYHERRESDPEGAITAARTLLETVCKHVLDEAGVPYEKGRTDLPDLYKLVAKELNLAPDQHTQDVFKQILGGVTSVVHGLGAMRNRLGDAHGQGKKPYDQYHGTYSSQ